MCLSYLHPPLLTKNRSPSTHNQNDKSNSPESPSCGTLALSTQRSIAALQRPLMGKEASSTNKDGLLITVLVLGTNILCHGFL